MVYLDEEEIFLAYEESTEEATQWRIDYPEYERLADNGLLDDLDENLPEVNDGSLAASLFKLAKRVIKKKLSGRAVALDRDEPWVTDLANIYWTKKILPNAKSKASPRRKWKDAVRKSAIYGGQPIINLFVERGNYRGSDFIVPYPQDVKLEAGKDSDEDSDIIFWDVYYSDLQLQNMLEEAKEEMKEGNAVATGAEASDVSKKGNEADDDTDNEESGESYEPYNKWNITALEAIITGNPDEQQRPGNEQPRAEQNKAHKKGGYHFFIAFQRGVNAPFKMLDPSTKECIREWNNPDPTGDVPVHYLYCYQDFINPYGIGIVQLAGGTQNVLDYMRQADILATQVGIRPPKVIAGDADEVDEDSLVMAQDANWFVGNASVEPWNMSNGVYQQLPARISMYQTSLQKMIPMGDTSISSTDSGDGMVSKTPAGVKLAAANLSIDDEDFNENVEETYALVARSMINTQFANMEGSDLLKLTSDEKDLLERGGLQFPQGSQELEMYWDHVRTRFDFEIDPEADVTEDKEAALNGMLKAWELYQSDDSIETDMAMSLKRVDKGELLADIFSALTKNDKIVVDINKETAVKIVQEAQRKAKEAADAASKPAQMPKSLGESVSWKPADLREGERAQALEQVGIKADMQGASPSEQQQDHDQQMDVVDAVAKTQPANGAPAGQTDAAKTNAPEGDQPDDAAHIKQIMDLYKVDEQTATAMLEADKQGYAPEEILSALQRQGAGVPEAANA